MDMLPKGVRRSLLVRDDDYRLSFLQGNFVTLTNVSDEEAGRIIECRLEPMNVSIHAVSEEVRVSLIGRRAMRGIEVLERLLDAGIEVHGQIVLCPGINDGEELERTLRWVEERPNITSLALVPLGYTKYSKRFSSSFSEDQLASRAVVELVAAYQAHSRHSLGITRFQLSDEFYLDAGIEVPPADTYDGYPQFYDGIGMLRSFIDETRELTCAREPEIAAARAALERDGLRVLLVCGEAALGVFAGLAEAWGPCVEARAIRNDYYGGDVNVTGLVVAEDLLRQLPAGLTGCLVVLPEPMFNYDRVTLDGVTLKDVTCELSGRGAEVCVSVPSPTGIADAIARFAGTSWATWARATSCAFSSLDERGSRRSAAHEA
jgi:putative radical SAM enzyme (TIGR03279 family)